MKKKALLAASILFVILTFSGAGYVLLSNGRNNAGYAVVPMLWATIFITAYRNQKG